MIHQKNNTTEYNRYPEIFKVCKSFFIGKKPTILSFGCSTGEECWSLTHYFPYSKITGVDIDDNILYKAELKNHHKNITYTNKLTGKYDLIFAMSVLCKWEDTKDKHDISSIYHFKQFEQQVKELDKHLNKGGLLVIYNANFRLKDTSIYSKYKPLKKIQSGFVTKFDNNNQVIEDNDFETIFIKQ